MLDDIISGKNKDPKYKPVKKEVYGVISDISVIASEYDNDIKTVYKTRNPAERNCSLESIASDIGE